VPQCPIAGDATAQIYHMQYKSNYWQNVFCIHRLFLCQAEAGYVLFKRPSGRKANKQFSMFTANHANRRVCPLRCSTYFVDHPRSDVVYNFGRVCLFVCLSDDNFRKPSRRKFISAHLVYLQGIRISVVYEGHRVKVKSQSTTGRKFPFLKCKTHIGNKSGSIKRTAMTFACSMGLSATAE